MRKKIYLYVWLLFAAVAISVKLFGLFFNLMDQPNDNLFFAGTVGVILLIAGWAEILIHLPKLYHEIRKIHENEKRMNNEEN